MKPRNFHHVFLFSWCILFVLILFSPTQSLEVQNQEASHNQAVAYQINPAHTGYIKIPRFRPPLYKKWEVDLPGEISYPLIADNKVFVTVADPSHYGTILYAFNASTGNKVWEPIPIDGTYWWSNAAYAKGRIFVINFGGKLSAYAARNGKLVWSRFLPGQYAFSSPPIVYRGFIYTGGAGSGGTLYAVRTFNGELLWTAPVENGDHSSPAVFRNGVYVSYACAQTYKFRRIKGILLWHHSTSCFGGGGRTPVYYQGRLYVRDWALNPPGGFIIDTRTGKLLGHFESDVIPAFQGIHGIFLKDGELKCQNIRKGNIKWTFQGDGGLSSAPIIINNNVYVGSILGNLFVLNIRTGVKIWETNVGSSIPNPDEHNVSQPLTGLGAAKKILVIPAGNKLIAYSPTRIRNSN